MHIHASAIGFLITAAYIIIFGFFWRFISTRYHETTFGQAMGVIY